MSEISIEAVTSSTRLGEGPHWDPTENVLYFVDIIAKEVHKYNPATKRETIAKIDGAAVSFIIPLEGQKNTFLTGIGHHICLMTWDGESEKPSKIEKLAIVDEEREKIKNQLNDGKADASGRLWTGTVAEMQEDGTLKKHQGSLYSYSKNDGVTKHVSEITTSNGLTWSLDNKTLYYIDSLTFKVDGFDFDIVKGVISNRRTIFDFIANGISGFPDGMTIDSDGNLFIACFSGGQVIQVDPQNGRLLQSIPIPCRQVTSVAFGGPNLDELYVTTGTFSLNREAEAEHPSAGCTFRVTGLKAKGLPMYKIKL